MENNKQEVNPLAFLNPAEDHDLEAIAEESKKNGNRWLYIPLDDESIQLPINDINKQILEYMSKTYKDEEDTIYIIGQKQFKIKPNNNEEL